ncbi:MAG: formylglycine-generating enzyme family protein [Chitinispirillaceae bacterium]|nr:formylglycine-generating enzyme family protein [Chitinispirillaceae bacterium]
MKILLYVLLSLSLFFSCTFQTAGTVDDVGSISGELLTENGVLVNYTVTVTLYRYAIEESASISAVNPLFTQFKRLETTSGVYRFDSLPSSNYRIDVTQDEIVVANQDAISLVSSPVVENPITVEDVVTIPFNVSNPNIFTMQESFIGNTKVGSSDSGYSIKTVKSNMSSLKLVVIHNTIADTVDVKAAFSSDTSVQFEVIDGPDGFSLAARGTDSDPDIDTVDIDTVDTIKTVYSGMKLIPAGTFVMGRNSVVSGADQPVNRVTTLTYDYWMDSTEITQKQYTDLMTKWYPSYKMPNWDSIHFSRVGDNYPAHSVNWIDAILYCNAKTRESGSTDTVYSYTADILFSNKEQMSKNVMESITIDLTRSGFHLPTEAQWEYACRAGTTTDYYFDSENIDNYAWYDKNSDKTSHPVALKIPNAFGLYDMSGNLYEWCNDWLTNDWLPMEQSNDPTGPSGPDPASGETKVLRGGSWGDYRFLQSWGHYGYEYEACVPTNGFRTCKTVR